MVDFLIIVQTDNAQLQHPPGLGNRGAISDDILIHGPHQPSVTGPAHNRRGNSTAHGR